MSEGDDGEAFDLAMILSLLELKDDVSGPDEQGRYLHTFKRSTERWTFSIEHVDERKAGGDE